MRTKHLVAALAAACGSMAVCASEPASSKEARPIATLTAGNAEVVVAKDAVPVVRFAADEATNFLSRVLGAPVPIVDAPSGGGKTSIILGESPWAKEAGITVEGRPRDTFVVRAEADRIYIVGRDDPKYDLQRHLRIGTGYGTFFQVERATLFGVYDFLERHAGCRFYFPHELGEIAPRADEVRVTERERVVTPSFLLRNPYFGGDGAWFCERDKADRARIKSLEWLRLRFATYSIPCCHGSQFFRYIERFGKDHPEYMAKKPNGERWLDPKVFAPYQLCWSNPGFQEELYQDVKAYLTGKPPSSRGLKTWGPGCRDNFVDIMPDDSFQGCSCERCQAAYVHLPGDRHHATELIWGVTAKIAQRLIDEGINGNVTQMAYRPYRRVPDFNLPTNVYVMVAESGPWSIVDPKRLAADNAEIRAWAEKLGHKVWIWTYPHKWGATRIDGLASVGPHAWGEYYKGVAPWIIGAFAECESESAFGNHLNYIVFSRLCWDQDVDVDAVLDEYHRLMFGAGAPDMKAFFETLEHKWLHEITGRIADTPVGPIASPPSARDIWTRIYSPAERARLAAMLASAKSKVAPASVEARRIDLMKREFFDGLEKSAKEWERMAETVARDIYDATLGKPLLIENLTGRKEPAKPGVRTEVRMAKTADAFVVEWDCEEPDMANTLCAERKDGDSEVWRDNGVEFKFNPSNDGRIYYQFILTERGTLFACKLFLDGANSKQDLSWSPNAKRFVEKTDRGWKARLEIPLSSLPWFADTFRGNFCRNRVRRAGEEFIVSSRYAKGYGSYEQFGTIKLK